MRQSKSVQSIFISLLLQKFTKQLKIEVSVDDSIYYLATLDIANIKFTYNLAEL